MYKYIYGDINFYFKLPSKKIIILAEKSSKIRRFSFFLFFIKLKDIRYLAFFHRINSHSVLPGIENDDSTNAKGTSFCVTLTEKCKLEDPSHYDGKGGGGYVVLVVVTLMNNNVADAVNGTL